MIRPHVAFAVALAAAAAGLLLSSSVRAGSSDAQGEAGGAVHLTLAPDLSFTDDSSSNYPIRGDNLRDGRIASDRPTVIFFGTSHCWNTNREAERVVALYRKIGPAARFLVVDLEHASAAQKPLVTRFYRGYIPTLAILDRQGKVVYNRSGETSSKRGDTSRLEEIVNQARE